LKVVIKPTYLIGEWDTWSIRSSGKVRLGFDLWVGWNGKYRIIDVMVFDLREQGYTKLANIGDYGNTTRFLQAWLQADHFGFLERDKQCWEEYLGALKASHVR